MSDIVIKAENLGKKYVIGHQAEKGRYVTLRDVLMQNARTLWNKTKDLAMGKPIIRGDTMEDVWALKDVNFEVRRGEAVGIIGRNGAGKSTLLKVLSRITEPTTGRVSIKGRVASLLEVGTGFNPELSGRENIYLNGTILGMNRVEIKRKFDEIVAFAEVERFLDTPVKRYSSGMYVRLAFAVAAHLEPEILVVDEVLAVGDAQFQKKCLGKMQEVGTEGRTVLFVSHNMGAISRLCQRTIVLEQGREAFTGDTEEAIAHYMCASAIKTAAWADIREAQRDNDNRQRIATSISLHRADGSGCAQFFTGDDMLISIGFETPREMIAYVQINFMDHRGDRVMVVHSTHGMYSLSISGSGTIECVLRDIRLLAGSYTIAIEIGKTLPQSDWLDYIPAAINFEIKIGQYLGGAEWTDGPSYGQVAQKSEWTTRSIKGGS